MQTTGCMAEYFTTVSTEIPQNINISVESAIEFVSRQPNTVDLFRSFELASQCIVMWNKRWYHIHSHQHYPSSVLCLCCPSIRVSVLRTTNCPCKVLYWCFWFRQELVSCWDSNAWLTCRRTVMPTCCRGQRVRNLKGDINWTSSSLWLPVSVIICIGCVLREIHRAAGSLANIEGWAKKGGSGPSGQTVWAKNVGVWAKIAKVVKECIFVTVGKGVISLGKKKFNDGLTLSLQHLDTCARADLSWRIGCKLNTHKCRDGTGSSGQNWNDRIYPYAMLGIIGDLWRIIALDAVARSKTYCRILALFS